jgi:putative sterol carrier protein
MSEKVKTYEDCFAKIQARYANEKIKNSLKTFSKPIMITTMDTSRSFMIIINKDQGIEIKDKTSDPKAPVKIQFITESVLIDLLNKELGAVKAYDSGKIKVVEGDIKSLLKLRKLLF